MKRLAFAAALALAATASHASAAPHEEIMRVDVRPGVVEPVLLSMASAGQKPKRVLLLFPGGDGVMEITRSPGGARFRLAGNFLIRARARFVDADDAAVSVDMPSDEYCCANDRFRLGERHAADVGKILDALEARFPGAQFYLVGPSRAAIDAAEIVPRLVPQRIAGVVLTSTLTLGGRAKPGLSHFDYSSLKVPVLFVHHKDDACRFTPYSEAERIAREYRFPLIAVTGSSGVHGPVCHAFSYHGYPGREKEVAAAIVR